MMRNTEAVITSRGKSDYSFLRTGKGVEALITLPGVNTNSPKFGIIKVTDSGEDGERRELTKVAYAQDYAIDDIRKYNEREEEVPIPYEDLGEGLTLLADTIPELKKFDEKAKRVFGAIIIELSSQDLEEEGKASNTVYLDVKKVQEEFNLQDIDDVRQQIREGLENLSSAYIYYKETDDRATFRMKGRILQASGSSLSHGLYKVVVSDAFLKFIIKDNQFKAYFPNRVLAYTNKTDINKATVLAKLTFNYRRNQKNGTRRNHTISIRELYECTSLPTVETVRASKGGNIAQRTISALVNILCTLTDNGDLNYWYFANEHGAELSTIAVEKMKAEQWMKLNVYYELNGYPVTEQKQITKKKKKKKKEEQHDN